jgi:hypothetical protein
MNARALVSLSLVFVLQTAPLRAEEICSDGRTMREQCQDLNAAYLREYRSDELARADYQCRRVRYAEHLDVTAAITGCEKLARIFSEMYLPEVPDCARAVECE